MKRLQHLLESANWLITACHALTTEGAITFSLSSSELNPLHVGETATVDVVVSGLEAGQELDSAGASLVFHANLLSSTAKVGQGRSVWKNRAPKRISYRYGFQRRWH